MAAKLGLAVIVSVITGPFDLGSVVVRTALFVNSSDVQVTAVSDPFPTIVDAKGTDDLTDGFPVRLRAVEVDLNKADFSLNPTNCEPLHVSAIFTSTSGRTAPASARFQVGGCRELPFKPSFTASTQAKASKAGGASLIVKVAQKSGEANIHKVDLQLPAKLPARLSTLQKACLAAVFEVNPAGCPEGSDIGTAIVHTPVLANPLSGPAYLVSHGNEAFPDVVFVLQGEGITIDLVGHTDIKKGITYSRFETVPDAPVTTFETVLPEGPHSILGTNLPAKAKGSLCGQKLTMGTTITGQNGAIIKQNTKIAVAGCPKTRTLTRVQKLTAILEQCRRKHGKHKRGTCEAQARKRYDPLNKASTIIRAGRK